MTTRGRSGIGKNRLADAERRAYLAAWEFLYAVDRLYPTEARQLRDLAEEADVVAGKSKSSHIRRTRAAVNRWLDAHELRCAAMEGAAWRWGRGYTTPEWEVYSPEVPGVGYLDELPNVTIWPDVFNETREKFLKRAGAHYDDVAAQLAKRGFTKGARKRELHHFVWLVKRIIGNQSWTKIAEEDGRTRLDEKTVASEARRTALLIGLPFRSQRGPRKGTKQIKRTPQARRR